MKKDNIILCINLGSTSTKLAIFADNVKLDDTTTEHPSDEISQYPDILSQLAMRKKVVEDYLRENNLKPEQINAIAVRGGPTGRRFHSGAYVIDEDMVQACKNPENAGHVMCLGPVLAYEWVKDHGIPAYNYDVVNVDEMPEIAHLTALPEIKRRSACHVLNTRAVAMEVAEEMGRSYGEMNLIMCHLGGGCSTSMHARGKIVDVIASGEGTFSPSRAGKIGNQAMINLCYSGKYTKKQLLDLLGNNSGLVAYLGTSDCRMVEKMIADGNKTAAMVYEAMAYNIAKDIGSLSVTADGEIDCIVLTGGIAYSVMLTKMIEKRVERIAPVVIKPGAIEMEALGRGILRVITGAETAHTMKEEY